MLETDLFERIRFRGDPIADPKSIVVRGKARFTVLTPRLLRLEWSEVGIFEDRSTYAFPTRRGPVPPFSVHDEGNTLVLKTSALTLRYNPDDGPLSAENLSITFDLDGQPQVWRFGDPNPLNLRGARRTLDMCEGDASLEEGLLSRAGWTFFDDSRHVLFEDGWVAPRPEYRLQDGYFFAYGHDYKAALADYTRFGGAVPLIPRFALGAWWSRYWAYSEQDLRDIVDGFEAHDLPLDVLVIDMDWHTPEGWTGYTWNRKLFPDPPAFLEWVHQRGLRVTLNLHPADGVQPHEEVYPQFAQAIGVDPASKMGIPFRITDRRFVRTYFELLHHPLEEQGVDFWWMDWQQGEVSEMKGLDPLPWLNHLHFQDATRRGNRPLLYSRWGGLGNHRYPIGFSGDTIVGWSALQFQPHMTATGSNVAYGWWSHDIGGHMGDATEPELYTRWVQFGALSPCLRLHGTKDPRTERRPWVYPPETYQAAKAAFHWRYRLLPYLYTLARLNHDTGLGPCRPMYYEYPEHDGAYAARYQYFLGDQMIAAPIVHPADPKTGIATTDVWVPPGTWIDFQTKEAFSGPRWVRLAGDLERIPMLVRAGGILPLAAPFQKATPPRLASGTSDAIPRDQLILAVFAGAEGRFRFYEDDGISQAYLEGDYEWTEITTQTKETTWEVVIAPVEGRCSALPETRSYQVCLEGSRCPQRVTVDGVEVDAWEYDPAALRTTIHVPSRSKRQATTVVATAAGGMVAVGEAHNQAVARVDAQRLLGAAYPPGEVETLLDAILPLDAPGWADAVARLGGPFARIVEFVAPEEASQQFGRVIVGAPAAGSPPFDVEATFTLRGPAGTRQVVVRRERATSDLLIDTPFAFDGTPQTMEWEATVTLTWRGRAWTVRHRSQPLCPTVPGWRVLVYDLQEKPAAPPVLAQDAADWPACVWRVAEVPNLAYPLVVFPGRFMQSKTTEGQAACLATTVISPDEREAIILFGASGKVDLFLNGQSVGPLWRADGLFRFVGDVYCSAPVRLRCGENVLVASNLPPEEGPWYVSVVLRWPDGRLMADLQFEPGPQP